MRRASEGVVLKSIAVTPNPATSMISGLGQTQPFTATGTYSDASTANLTDAVHWISSNLAVATFSPDGTDGGVASAIGPGTTNVRAQLGAVTSPVVALLVTFGADFTKSTVPSGIVAVRDAGSAGSLIWPVRGQGTELVQTPTDASIIGLPTFEDRSPLLPPGWCNHRPYTNAIPDPFYFGPTTGAPDVWFSIGPFPFGAPAHTTAALATGATGPFAPDGKSNVWTIAVVQPFPDANHYGIHEFQPGGPASGLDPWQSFPGIFSVWMKDNPANPSNIPIISGPGGGPGQGIWRASEKSRYLKHAFNNFVANGWQELVNLLAVNPPAAGGSFAGTCFATIQPSTLHGLDAGASPAGFQDADAGSVMVAGAQLTCDSQFYAAQTASKMPLAKNGGRSGFIGGTTFSLQNPGNVVVNGEFDFEFQFIPGWRECLMQVGPSNPHGGGNPAWNGTHYFAGETPDGEISFRYDDSIPGGAWKLVVRGVEVLSMSSSNSAGMFANSDQLVTVRVWYKPLTTGQCGVRFTVNGAFHPATTAAAAGPALSPPTSFYLMHIPFANPLVTQPWQMPGMLTGSLKVLPPGTSDADPSVPGMIVHLGDSLIRSNGRYVATPSYTWTGLESSQGGAPPVAVLALGGATLAGQLATWIASPYRGDPNVAAVVIEGGINDIILNRSSAQILADYQAIIADVAANNPTAKIIVTQVAPAFVYFTAHPNPSAAAMETKRQTINTQLVDGTITGFNDIVEEHITLLQDTDNQSLLASLDVGVGLGPNDGLHYTTDGRRIHGFALRRVLLRQGLYRPTLSPPILMAA